MGAQKDACYWRLAREGVCLVLNNKLEDAVALFKRYPNNIQMYSGYASVLFLDALLTFEEEKLSQATQSLKELESRCSGTSWLKISRAKNVDTALGYAEHLESQIIRADSQMFLATLAFLQQDISAYFKGAWVLRKSWKNYQQTYKEISSLYELIVGDNKPPSIVEKFPSATTIPLKAGPSNYQEESDMEMDHASNKTSCCSLGCKVSSAKDENSAATFIRTVESDIPDLPPDAVNSEPDEAHSEINVVYSGTDVAQSESNVSQRMTRSESALQAADAQPTIPSDQTALEIPAVRNTRSSECSMRAPNAKPILRNGYIPKSHTMHFESDSNSTSSPKSTTHTTPPRKRSMKKSQSVSSTLARYNNHFQKNLGRLSSPLNSSLSYISSLYPFNTEGVRIVEIDKETITRLMCGISFGYGMLQLGMSLLPSSIARLTNFLGFQGDRIGGLANLNYARNGTDMRAPMATLALLWYHTIVRPFFALDGNNVQAGVEIATKLIEESMSEYANSSLFLFFRGRLARLKSDIPDAIRCYEASIQNSNQREIRIIAQHEVAWCHLIELDYRQAFRTFLNLKQQSRWSRSFYTYLYVVSAGANQSIGEAANFEELRAVFGSAPKGSQLDEFLARRFKVCPSIKEGVMNVQPIYWRLLVYELLYLWNSMPSCNIDNVNGIIQDCENAIQDNVREPFLGLSNLMAGSGYCILRDYTNGIRSFRDCLQRRKCTTPVQADDTHIPAFASYELGCLLIKEEGTKPEGKLCLEQVLTYKNYDFEQRLSVRIDSILEHL